MAKVLVVDDDPFIRDYYRELLNLNNFQVESVGNSYVVQEKAKLFNPDVILLDVLLPSMSGIKLLENLKKDPLTAASRVIMLTNLDDEETAKEAMKKGAATYIIKANTSGDELVNLVRKYIQNK